MRRLFDIDKKDYTRTETVFSRPSARAVIIEDGRIAMVHSLKYGYYKFPGGGIEPGGGAGLHPRPGGPGGDGPNS